MLRALVRRLRRGRCRSWEVVTLREATGGGKGKAEYIASRVWNGGGTCTVDEVDGGGTSAGNWRLRLVGWVVRRVEGHLTGEERRRGGARVLVLSVCRALQSWTPAVWVLPFKSSSLQVPRYLGTTRAARGRRMLALNRPSALPFSPHPPSPAGCHELER